MGKPRKGESREEYLARRREEGRQIYANMTPEQKEHKREQMKQYRQNNKESIAEKKKQYRQNNKEHICERLKRWHQNNPEYDKRRHRDNPEVKLLSGYRQSDAQYDRDNDLTLEFVRDNIYQPCHYCGGMADVGYNGLDRMDSSLGHLQSNCIPCCPTCNKQKGTKSYKDFIAMRRG